MFHVLCLGIWWCHDIWISGKLKFEYLKTEKCFSNEIKKYLSLFHKSSFSLSKQTNKNVAYRIFNYDLLTNLWVRILCSFRLVLEKQEGKEINESSRLEFIKKFLINNFALLDAEYNTSGLSKQIYLCWEHYWQFAKSPDSQVSGKW